MSDKIFINNCTKCESFDKSLMLCNLRKVIVENPFKTKCDRFETESVKSEVTEWHEDHSLTFTFKNKFDLEKAYDLIARSGLDFQLTGLAEYQFGVTRRINDNT